MKIVELIFGILILLLLAFRAIRLFATGTLEMNGYDTRWKRNPFAFVLATVVHLALMGFAVHAIWLLFSR
jgi:hypothetical protein